jgi:hypothetical protein
MAYTFGEEISDVSTTSTLPTTIQIASTAGLLALPFVKSFDHGSGYFNGRFLLCAIILLLLALASSHFVSRTSPWRAIWISIFAMVLFVVSFGLTMVIR